MKKKTRLSADAWKKIARDAYQPGNWFRFPLTYLDIMTLQEAVMLAFLHNHSMRCKKEGEWFFCKVSLITKALRVHTRTQSRVFRSLASKGFIQMQSRGIPAKRWITIDWDALGEELNKAPQAPLDDDGPFDDDWE